MKESAFAKTYSDTSFVPVIHSEKHIGSTTSVEHTDTSCVPVIYSEKHMGSMISVIPKYYLFTDIFRTSENVDGSGPSTALLEKDFIGTMGNGGKTLWMKDKRTYAWAEASILVACFSGFSFSI